VAYVVTGSCQNCYHKDCVLVCPVDCFFGDEKEKMMYIEPDMCINCNACVPECPEEAIFEEDDIPEGQEKWIKINEEKSQSGLPCVTTKD
jgi:ferredoxin